MLPDLDSVLAGRAGQETCFVSLQLSRNLCCESQYDHLFFGAASSQTFVSLGANGFYYSEICFTFS